MKAILKTENVNAYIDMHKKMKIPFTLTLSTYTARIKSNFCDIHFMKSEQPMRVFCAYNMIKADVVKHPIKKVNTGTLQYFSQAFKNEDFYSDVIFNIDIKSAYATILKNDGLITAKTFDFINRLPKQERLTAVGMLAGKKNIFEMDADGNCINDKTEISPTADYFFYCVKRTSQHINKIASHLGNAFLFSWVDGVYFLQDEKASNTAGRILTEYLQEENFKASYEKLTDFEVLVKKDYYNCTYKKNDKEKVLNIPRPEHEIVTKITNHLLTKNYN